MCLAGSFYAQFCTDYIAHLLCHEARGGGLAADDGKETRCTLLGVIVATKAARRRASPT